MSKYYCGKCKCFHSKGKDFKEHKEFDLKLTKHEIWILEFKRSCKNYSKKSHSKIFGSKKQ